MNKTALIAVAGVLILGGLAYGVRQMTDKTNDSISTNITEKLVEGAVGNGADVDIKADGTVDVSTTAGSASYGTSPTIQADFPKPVPTPSAGTLTSSYSGEEGGKKSHAIMYTFKGVSVSEVSLTYRTQLESAGFTVSSAGSGSANGTHAAGFTATKDSYEVNVAITNLGGNDTLLTITVKE